jgi:transcriptional regulator with XRE-family HTH domain
MITNEREYRIARAELRRFEEELSKPRLVAEQPGVHPVLVAATPAILNQQLEDLRGEVREYEELRSGIHRSWEFSDLGSLPQVLIESRIARGLTQRELADECKVREQAIQRYEDNRYAGASFERIVDVADALGLYVHVIASLDPQVTRVVPTAEIFTTPLLGVAMPATSAISVFAPSGFDSIAVSMANVRSMLGAWPMASVFNLVGQASGYPFGREYFRPVGLGVVLPPPEVPRERLAWPIEQNQKLPDLQVAGAIPR